MLIARRLALIALPCLVLLLGVVVDGAQAASRPDYVPGEVVVGYQPQPVATFAKALAKTMGVRAPVASVPDRRASS